MTLISDGTHKTPEYVNEGVKFVSVQNISSGSLDFSKSKRISIEECELLDRRCVPTKNDLLICRIGTLGKPIVIKSDEKFQIFVSLGLIRPAIKEMADYLCYYLNSGMARKYIDYIKIGGGTHTYKINLEDLATFPIPVPPAKTQKEIVERIEELMPLVDEYERVWNRLDVLNKSISSELTRSLLKAAAEGKLPYSSVGNSQDNNYLQLVRDDSLAFEKALGKKASPILPIEESEIPFDIPDNWSWMRLSQLVSKRIKRGKSPKYIKSSGVLVFAQKCNTKKGYIDLSLSQFLDESQLSKYDESEYMEDGDIVINSTGGGTLGRVGIYRTGDNPLKMPIVPDSHVTVVRVNPRVNNKFVYYVLKYYQPYLETLGDGSTNQTELNPMTIAKLLIPLPPRAEQDSIVATLEAVLPLCRDLETNPRA